jgi:hypothetical protein
MLMPMLMQVVHHLPLPTQLLMQVVHHLPLPTQLLLPPERPKLYIHAPPRLAFMTQTLHPCPSQASLHDPSSSGVCQDLCYIFKGKGGATQVRGWSSQ